MSNDFYAPPCDIGPLFTQRAPSVNGSITSAAAADSLSPHTLNAMQRRVLELLAATPEGLTDEEMQRRLQMNPSTQRPRRIELSRLGMVVEAGTRKTASGRKASVWQATAASR
jgi:transcription initiation factor IIE alpha subunit